ncbi:MAG: nucleotidyl transferase AbiEii/AbiGii toxin family protein [Caldilineaceae bacterium]|nr:nucleotidyl transferase AbiEii/AbiGii toxin family protein [Caldilineaceae bacterium]
MDERHYYFEQLYPLQDQVLKVINRVETGFYLTGGTAVSRAYLQHRYSDDLDLFVNYDPNFAIWSSILIDTLVAQEQWTCEISMRQQFFVRLLLVQNETVLKIELVNDVPARVGEVQEHPTLGQIDSAENILANKLSALIGRDEPRDLADIWGLCTKLGLSLKEAIDGAQSKATGIYPPDLARKLCTVTHREWELIRWIDPPVPEQYIAELNTLGEGLILV